MGKTKQLFFFFPMTARIWCCWHLEKAQGCDVLRKDSGTGCRVKGREGCCVLNVHVFSLEITAERRPVLKRDDYDKTC